MGNARVVLIIAALFAVLLSAFAAGRLRLCRGERQCLPQSSGFLPAARFFAVRPAPDPAPAGLEAEARPLP